MSLDRVCRHPRVVVARRDVLWAARPETSTWEYSCEVFLAFLFASGEKQRDRGQAEAFFKHVKPDVGGSAEK